MPLSWSRRATAIVALTLAVAVVTTSTFTDERPAGAATEPARNTVTAYGAAPDHGPSGGMSLHRPLVGIDARRDGSGYWAVASDGGVFAFGDAGFHGSTGDIRLNQPVVGIASTPAGDGYWLVASDGGVFSFGTARFHGSMGGVRLNRPVVGMAAHPDGDGYWLVASDGGIFSFGAAGFHGSTGSIRLNSPIVGMAAHPGGDGYWLVAADGGVFTFGDAEFRGSMGDGELPAPVRGMAAAPDGSGYWIVGEDGQVYPFGPPDHGNAAASDDAVRPPVVGMAAHSVEGYWLVHGERLRAEIHDEGPHVTRLQRRLRDLGYWVGPVDGVYGELTRQAVYAFEKYSGRPIDGRVDPGDQDALSRAGRPAGRTTAGDVIEVDKTRQLLFFVDDGRVSWVFNTSTGTEEPYTYRGRDYMADTPPGRWEMFREVDGWRESNLGRLYRPKYFHSDGIAVHGYTFVPPYPASHGCVRVTLPAMDFIWASGLAPMGADVWVYGTTPRR